MLKIEAHVLLETFGTNTWLLYGDTCKEALLIDPSMPSEPLLKRIKDLGLKVKYIINTHGHGDHIGGNKWFKDHLGCPLAIHRLDAAMLLDNRKNFSLYMDSPVEPVAADLILEDGMELDFASRKLRIIHTPGHTPGCICLLVEKFLISGDTLFEQSIGRTDFPGGSHADIIHSIKTKLFTLDDDTIVYPGHGPRTTIGLEKASNPFIR